MTVETLQNEHGVYEAVKPNQSEWLNNLKIVNDWRSETRGKVLEFKVTSSNSDK